MENLERITANTEEVITIEICGEYFKLGCDKDIFAYFYAHYRHFFPKLTERSKFVRVDGRWFFLSGKKIAPPPARRPASKVGRNDPCPCGSGKKYKHCHGKLS